MKALKQLVTIAAILGIFVSFGFAANEFADMEATIVTASNSGKKVLGEGIKWFLALALPIICLGTGTLMGYSQQKKKAEQDQNTNKIYLVAAVGGLVGFFVYILVATIVSKALFGDPSYGFNVITAFWKSANPIEWLLALLAFLR